MDWREELAHVAKRINALAHNHPDPGSLAATAKQRREALKVHKDNLKKV
jgi:hypothetical protein